MTHKKFVLLALLLFIFSSIFAEESNDWIIAATEFDTTEVPTVYQAYSTVIPKLFLYNLNSDARRVIPLSERKERNLLELSQKKLKLIKELEALILEKDKLFLAIDSEKSKNKKRADIQKKIEEKKKAIFFANADMKIEDLKFSVDEENKAVVPWKNGEELLELSKNSGVIDVLIKNNISAVITGCIRDITGYAYVSVKLETGLPNMPVIEFADAGPYEDITNIVKGLSAQLYQKIQNVPAIKLYLDVTPSTAKVLINETLLEDFSKPVTVYPGELSVYAYCDGYKPSSKMLKIDNASKYKLTIALPEDKFFGLNFDINGLKPDVYFKAQYFGVTPAKLKLPKSKEVLEVDNDGITTFVVFDPEKFYGYDEVINVTSKLRKESVTKKITRRRNAMYWSLGAVYISLPATLILTGITNDRISALSTGRLPNTSENIQKTQNLYIAKNVMLGVTAGLAVNYLVQMVLYLVAADQTLPTKIEPIPIPMVNNNNK